MDDLPRRKLIELVGRFGRDVANDARRCEALLKDFCPQCKREVFVLISAAKELVPIELLGSSSGMPKQVLISRLSKRLHDNLGVAEGFARWAVESWALALEVVTIDDITIETTSQARGQNTYWSARPSGRDARYDQALIGCDRAILQMFSDIAIEWEGKTFLVPAIYGSQEDAVAYVLQDSKGKGVNEAVERVRLPLLAIWSSRCAENSSRYDHYMEAAKRAYLHSDGRFPTVAVDVHYSLWAWAIFGPDIEQMSAQVRKKLEGGGFVQEAGAAWRTAVTLCAITNNLDSNGKPPPTKDGTAVIYKYQFDFIAEAFLRLPGQTPESSQSEEGQRPRKKRDAASSSKKKPKAVPSIELTEILLEPQRYVGQSVWLKGIYESVHLQDKCFWLRVEEGHIVEVYYAALPKEQQAIVLNERRAEGHPVLVEGRLEEVGGVFSGFAIHASQVRIKGLKSKTRSQGRSAADIDWDGCGRCPKCHTLINIKFDDAVCPVCAHRMNYQEAFQACGSCSVDLPRNVFSEKDLEDEDEDAGPTQADHATVTNSTVESVSATPPKPMAGSVDLFGEVLSPDLVGKDDFQLTSMEDLGEIPTLDLSETPTPPPAPSVGADWITEQYLSDIVWSLKCPRIEELKVRFAARSSASPQQIQNIRSACHISLGEPILALIDVTIRKNGMNGICFTSRGVYWHYKFIGIGGGHGFLEYGQFTQEAFDPKGSDEILTRAGVVTMSTSSAARDPTIVLLRTLRDRIAHSVQVNPAPDHPPASGSPSSRLNTQVAADVANALKADRSVAGLKSFVEKVAASRLSAWRKAAEGGVPGAQWLFGYCFYEGIAVPQNFSEAVKWGRRAAEQGFVAAQAALASCYFGGQGVTQDYSEAFKWSCKAAEHGDADGQFFLGLCYANGQGVAQDQCEAVKWYHMAAEQGNPNGQNWLGLCYAGGQGVAQNLAEAAMWYRKAADQGHPAGQVNLGACYQTGQGVVQNDGEAAKWFRKAAEQGDADGQNYLGVCYENGQGVAQNNAEAAEWYRKAADQGHPLGQTNLGGCYRDGRGVTQSDAEALKWLHASAEKGEPIAQCALADCYAAGQGVQQDYAEAAKWYRKSAEQGFAGAQFGLGLCYQNGLGASQDSGEAMKWLRSAADQGHADARDALRQGSSGPQIPSRTGTEINSGTVRHKCPACGKGLKIGASAAGKRVPCPGCKILLEVSADLRVLTVRHKCPACGKGVKMGANVAGRQIPCPACHALLDISGDLQTIVDVTDTGEKIELLDVADDPGEFGVIDLGELGPDDLSG